MTTMRKTAALLLSLCLLLGFLPMRAGRAATDYSWVKVKLTTNNATSLTLYANGEYFIKENGVAFSGGNLTVRASGGKLHIEHANYGEIYAGKSCSIQRANVDRSAGYLSLNGRRYLGHFNLKVTGSGYIQVVNQVPMAHYLYGVVGYEMSDLTFPLEALKAQAIAAKGYVIAQMGSSDYDIGDTSADQVYKGYDSAYTNVITAVESTLSEVLAVNGSIVRTYFAASNGGETNLPTYAWPTKNRANTGYAVSQDPYDLANIYSSCETVKIPVNTAASISSGLYNFIVAKATAALGVNVTGIEGIYSVSTYGEAYSGTARNQTTGSMSVGVRDGAGNLLQTNFTFRLSELYSYGVVGNASLRIYWGETVGNYYYIYHVRYGHGVGLSQRGAQQRASQGQNYQQILAFYYPGAQLVSTSAISQPQNPVNTLAGTVLPGQALTTPGPETTPASGASGVQAYGRINYDDTNYRSGPGTTYPSYGKLDTGVALEIYGESGNWYLVGVNGTQAYVYKQYVDITGHPTAAQSEAVATPTPAPIFAESTQPTQLSAGMATTSNVNFRTGPGTNYKSLGKLDKGDVISIYGQEGSWYYGAVENVFGYVSNKYVKLSQAIQQPTAAPTPVQSAATAQAGMLTTGNVNFRSAASKSSTSLKKLSKNTAVTVLSQSGDWYYVLCGTQYGYVYKQYVKITGPAQSVSTGSATTGGSAAPAGSTGAGVTTGSVNMRKGAATSFAKITTLKKGAVLTLYGTQNGWYSAKTADGKTGYVSGKYVQVTAAYGTGSESTSLSANTSGIFAGEPVQSAQSGYPAYGETTGKVNFRDGPSTSSRKLAQLPKGAQLTLYGLQSGWFEAGYNFLRGYVSAEYVKKGAQLITNSTPASGTSVTTGTSTAVTPVSAITTEGSVKPGTGRTTGEVNFRTRPDTKNSVVIELIPRDATVQLLGKCGEWYYALYNGRSGYLSGAYVKVAEAGSFGMPTVAADTAAYATTTSGEVNLRSGPATSYAKLGVLPGGTAITVFILAEGWCLIQQGGNWGFVSAEYVNLR